MCMRLAELWKVFCCSIIRVQLKTQYGGVAQLGEHLPCKQGVMGSIPIISTTDLKVGERWSNKKIPEQE